MKLRLIFFLLISFVFASGCSTYNEMVPKWAEICSKPVNKKDASWYKICNFKSPEFKKLIDD